MNASMIVENERTLTMLQRDQGALEKALQDAGLNMSGKNMNFSLMKQNQENRADDFANLGNSHGDDSANEEISPMAAMEQASMGYSNQAIDISV